MQITHPRISVCARAALRSGFWTERQFIVAVKIVFVILLLQIDKPHPGEGAQAISLAVWQVVDGQQNMPLLSGGAIRNTTNSSSSTRTATTSWFYATGVRNTFLSPSGLSVICRWKWKKVSVLWSRSRAVATAFLAHLIHLLRVLANHWFIGSCRAPTTLVTCDAVKGHFSSGIVRNHEIRCRMFDYVNNPPLKKLPQFISLKFNTYCYGGNTARLF